jgi:pyrroline-5-carboxylate reductase
MTQPPSAAALAAMPSAISFIGGGNMATAMIRGLRQHAPGCAITVAEPDPGKRAGFTAQGLTATFDNGLATAASTVVVLAIKPQLAVAVLPEIAAAWSEGKLLVSILAGTTTARLEALLPPGARVVRAMPNTPLAIGAGMVGLCRGRHAGADDLAQAEALFAPSGRVLHVADEGRMDAVTAVSGSGPAYLFALAESLIAGAVALGFTAEEATLLVGQTLAGSVRYWLESGQPPARLREQVTSPGGTTAAALAVLAGHDHAGMWREALAAAERRGRELAAG